MVDGKDVSKAGSFKGYNLITAISRNKDSIKVFLALIAGINMIPPFSWRSVGITLLAGLVALTIKILADAVDFFSKDVVV